VAATLEAVAGQIGGRGGEGVAIGCGGVQSTPAAARVALEAATRGCGCFRASAMDGGAEGGVRSADGVVGPA